MALRQSSGHPHQPSSKTPVHPRAGDRPLGPPPRTPPPVAKVSGRWPFWLGFAVSFLFLTAASIAILLLSTGVDNFDLATLQGGEAAWTPPEIIPTATSDPAIGAAASSANGSFASGSFLRNVTNTNVLIRQTPGNLSKPENDVIGRIPSGERVEIIGGPATADGLIWWQVRYSAAGQMLEGWSAEVTASGLRILGAE